MGEKKYENLEKKLCRELEMLEEKIKANSGEMSTQDLEKIDKIVHALKSLATYSAMKESEEYGEEGFSGAGYSGEGGNSGRRGRGANGRYVSRDGGSSFADGYSRGYSEAMSQMSMAEGGGNSGHYPMMPPYYPNRRY